MTDALCQKAKQSLEVSEFRHLVEAMLSPTLAAYVAILGETAMRKQEALFLKWSHIDCKSKIVSVEHTKNNRVR